MIYFVNYEIWDVVIFDSPGCGATIHVKFIPVLNMKLI